jgi:hypothetical protein
MAINFFAVIVFLAGLFASRNGVLYWQMVFCLFAAATALSLPALGGAVITPGVLFLPFLMLRAWLDVRGTNYLGRIPAAGVWLALLVMWAVVGSIFIPRLLAGEVMVLTIDRSAPVLGPALFPLRPVSGNITQSGYAVGGLCAFLAIRGLLERPGRLDHFCSAVLLLSSLNCAAALLNLAEFHLGLPSLLDHVRTAYASFEAYEAAGTGLMRIQGTFPETSGFCVFTIPLFAFTFSLWLNRVRPLYTGVLSLVSFLLLLFSTSTTAYVGLTIYFAILAFVLTRRGYLRGSVPRVGMLAAAGLLLLVLVGSAFVLETRVADQVTHHFAVTVFQKLETKSGMERGTWNRQAWQNFLETFGLGVGLGSARGSSYPLVLLSNVGLIGTVLFCAFLWRVFQRPRGNSEPIPPICEAARQSVLAALAATAVSYGVFDLGVAFYALAAAATLNTAAAGAHHWQYRHFYPPEGSESLRSAMRFSSPRAGSTGSP